ncbi:MAG: hypothetical protein K5695_13730 [Oscillospiraceae bacterium]|nr:hypothetical protein [Oscillospiraceae bacterium]
MDTGCMIDGAWLQSLANGGEPDDSQALPARDALVRAFVDYYAAISGWKRTDPGITQGEEHFHE